MFKKMKERSTHFLAIAFVLGLFMGVNVSFLASAEEPAHKYLDYFHRIYQILRNEYVDQTDNKELFYGAMRGMIKSLDDPFSRFLDEESYEELREMTSGKFVGVGIEITTKDDEVVVISPIEDSPAMKAGIHAGDIITKVNDTRVKGMKLSEIVKLIKGLPKTRVNLQISREGYDEPIDVSMERASIKIRSVDYGVIDGHDAGYIRIMNFGNDTPSDVSKALKFFNQKKIDRLILDLRYNPGGLLSAAVEISDMFLEPAKVIVSTRGRDGVNPERVFKSENDPIGREKLVVLVNKGSASASEILAGAIRDNKRGTLVGEKTFGKGSVQKSYDLGDDVGVAITIAKYFTPSGECIHKVGIEPDEKVEPYKFLKDEMKYINQMTKDNIAEEYIKKDMEYSESSRIAFRSYLKSKDIQISDRSSDMILYNIINRYRKKPLYSIEFDDQLARGLEILKK